MCSQARTRLIILTDGKNNHNIKIAETGQLAVAPWTANILLIISEDTERIDYLDGEGGGGERRVREENGLVIIANIIYIILINIMLADFHHFLLF